MNRNIQITEHIYRASANLDKAIIKARKIGDQQWLAALIPIRDKLVNLLASPYKQPEDIQPYINDGDDDELYANK